LALHHELNKFFSKKMVVCTSTYDNISIMSYAHKALSLIDIEITRSAEGAMIRLHVMPEDLRGDAFRVDIPMETTDCFLLSKYILRVASRMKIID
jgi:hypothetical protein